MMSFYEEVIEIVSEVINTFEEEDGFQHFDLIFSWNRKVFKIICTNSEKQNIHYQYLELTTFEPEKKKFVKDLIEKLKVLLFLHLNISLNLIDRDNNAEYLSVKSHTTLVEKVQAIYQLHPNEFFKVKFAQNDHHAEIMFFLRDVSSSVILTAGYFNPVATQQLLLNILGLNSCPDNVCFVGVIDKDNQSKINKCLEKAANAVKNKIEEFNYGNKSVSHIDAMSENEILQKFFSDQKELIKKCDEDEPLVDSTAGEDQIVDLTIYEEDKVSKAENISVTSSCFYEACVSISESCSDDKKEKMFIQNPVDPQWFEDFVMAADVTFVLDPEDHQVETRSLRSLETDIAPLVAQMHLRQEDEEEENKESSKREEDSKSSISSRSTLKPSSSHALQTRNEQMEKIIQNIKNLKTTPLSEESSGKENDEVVEVAVDVVNVKNTYITINSQGVRKRKLYSPEPPQKFK